MTIVTTYCSQCGAELSGPAHFYGEPAEPALSGLQDQAINNANAALSAAGLPTYTELVRLIHAAARLSLSFDVGNAYIRRAYVDEQDALMRRVNALPKI